MFYIFYEASSILQIIFNSSYCIFSVQYAPVLILKCTQFVPLLLLNLIRDNLSVINTKQPAARHMESESDERGGELERPISSIIHVPNNTDWQINLSDDKAIRGRLCCVVRLSRNGPISGITNTSRENTSIQRDSTITQTSNANIYTQWHFLDFFFFFAQKDVFVTFY